MMKGKKQSAVGVLIAAGLGVLVFYAPAGEAHHCRGGHGVQLVCAHGAGEASRRAAANEKQYKQNPDEERNDEKCGEIHPAEILGNKLVCPVMERGFTLKEDSAYREHGGKVYFFCCPGCAPRFTADPEKYAGEAEERGRGHRGH